MSSGSGNPAAAAPGRRVSGGGSAPAPSTAATSTAAAAAAAATAVKRTSVIKAASPQRDLALVHTLRRDELRSRGGGGGEGAPPPVGGSASSRPGTGGGAARLPPTVPAPAQVGSSDGGGDDLEDTSPLLQLHETAGVILDEEEELLNAHMAAIQENAELLTEEGKLLAEVQGVDVVDYDIDRYATALHDVLARKLATTQALLRRLAVFRDHLALEEQVSKAVGAEDMRLA